MDVGFAYHVPFRIHIKNFGAACPMESVFWVVEMFAAKTLIGLFHGNFDYCSMGQKLDSEMSEALAAAQDQ